MQTTPAELFSTVCLLVKEESGIYEYGQVNLHTDCVLCAHCTDYMHTTCKSHWWTNWKAVCLHNQAIEIDVWSNTQPIMSLHWFIRFKDLNLSVSLSSLLHRAAGPHATRFTSASRSSGPGKLRQAPWPGSPNRNSLLQNRSIWLRKAALL